MVPRIIRALGTFFLATAFIPSIVFAIMVDASEIAQMKERGYINIGIRSEDNAPFVTKQAISQDNDQYTGFEIELVSGLAVSLGIEARFQDFAYVRDMIDAVANGDMDIAISRISRNLQRSQRVIFSYPYYKLPLEVVERRVLQSAAKEEKLKLGTIMATSFVEIAERYFPHYELVKYAQLDQIFDSLEQQVIDAALLDELLIYQWFQQNPEQSLYFSSKNLQEIDAELPQITDDIVIAIRPNYIHLQQFINGYLDESKIHGHFSDLEDKYFGQY